MAYLTLRLITVDLHPTHNGVFAEKGVIKTIFHVRKLECVTLVKTAERTPTESYKNRQWWGGVSFLFLYTFPK